MWRMLVLVGFVLLPLQGCKTDAEEKVVDEFSLQLFDGRTFTLSKHKHEEIVVNFFASWCAPCRVEAPALEAVHQSYLSEDVVFLGVAIKDSKSAAKGFVEKYGLTFPTGLDEDGILRIAFGVYGLPATFFINREGIITYTHHGAVTEELIVHELEKIL